MSPFCFYKNLHNMSWYVCALTTSGMTSQLRSWPRLLKVLTTFGLHENPAQQAQKVC